jgi:ribosomal protein L7/L12
MYLKLTLKEAIKFIASKVGCNEIDVNIILPEQKKEVEVFKDSRNDFSDKCIRVGLVRDVKRALTVIDSGKMFAIRYVRYRAPSLGLKDAKAFVEMSENGFNDFIESGYLPNGRVLV